MTFVIDIDGTLCPLKLPNQKYEDMEPYSQMIDKLREYKSEGAKIILYTSHNMNSYNGNIGLINANTAKILLSWLDKWHIPYDEVYYGKPWPGHNGFYVDDRSVRPNEFLTLSLDELTVLCENARYK